MTVKAVRSRIDYSRCLSGRRCTGPLAPLGDQEWKRGTFIIPCGELNHQPRVCCWFWFLPGLLTHLQTFSTQKCGQMPVARSNSRTDRPQMKRTETLSPTAIVDGWRGECLRKLTLKLENSCGVFPRLESRRSVGAACQGAQTASGSVQVKIRNLKKKYIYIAALHS